MNITMDKYPFIEMAQNEFRQGCGRQGQPAIYGLPDLAIQRSSEIESLKLFYRVGV
ncbi:MAG: hypothetical protein ACYC1M_01445 [Armatimonadota bacterium]